MEQVRSKEGGNTISPSSRQIGSKRWCFTFNNYKEPEDVEQMEALFKKHQCRFVMGKEKGEQGTAHLQGYIESDKRIRPLETFKTTKVHWEKCKGTKDENIKYCTKENSFLTNFPSLKPLKILGHDQLYEWQKAIVEIIKNDPDERTIHWYWDKKGCSGKTTFCKYLSHHYKAVPLEGKKNDVLYVAAEFESEIYLWDLERSMEEYVSYASIEKIKNGYYTCGKYEGRPILRNCPHVIVFANFAPDLTKLSADRWNVVNI